MYHTYIMAESEQASYNDTIKQALNGKRDWFERDELIKLKEELRTFQSSFASLYNIYLKKKLIDEDPYKQETKISEIEVPDTGVLIEAKRLEQLSIRLSNFDSQLDFLVNFYQLHVDFLNLERIKRIVGLIRYIDWLSLTPDNQSSMTKAVAEITNQSKVGVDGITLSIIGESLTRLGKTTTQIMNQLKDLNMFYRESYKLEIREKVTTGMSAGDATVESIRKKIPSAMPGFPFYKDLVEEVIKEDFTKGGAEFKEAILKTLKVPEEKPKAVKPPVNFKNILLDGIQVIGGAGATLTEIVGKFEDNQTVMESRKKGFFYAIKELIRQITNAEPEEVIYHVEYLDSTKGVPVKERVNFHQFQEEIGKKSKILNSFVRGPAYQKLSAMTEEQIISYLEKNIRDVQTYHKTLSALDDYFKGNVVPEDRDKIKGIKPELSTLKNSIVKANQLRHEYSAQKEEEEQLKRLGVNPVTAAAGPPPLPPPA
jgi:hypothetical protein